MWPALHISGWWFNQMQFKVNVKLFEQVTLNGILPFVQMLNQMSNTESYVNHILYCNSL